jgi:hypothetical protein
VLDLKELPTLEALRDEQRGLRSVLARLRRRLRLQLALELAADLAVALAVTAALLVALDWWFRFHLPVRAALLAVCLLVVCGLLALRTARRLQAARLDELSLAMTLDRFRPGIGQQIADVLQLPGLLDESGATASPALVRLAVQHASAALAGSDWRSLWNRKRTASYGGALGLALLIPGLFALLAPAAARLSVARWLLGSSERWPQQVYLSVMGLDDRGRLIAPRNEPFVMEVRSDLPLLEPRGRKWVVKGRDEPLVIARKPARPRAPAEVRVSERMRRGTTRAATMVETGPGRFRYEFPPEAASSRFHLTGGDDWLGPLVVERVDRPSLVETRLRVKEPGTADPGFRTIEDPRQHLLFLPDTEVELTLVGSEKLSDATLKVHPGSPPNTRRTDPRTFLATWTLREAVTLEIVLTSAQTGLLSRPSFLSLGIMRDREPRLALRALGVGAKVTPVATIPLALSATDDLGLAALRLQVERTTFSDEQSQPQTKRTAVEFPLPPDPGRAILDHQVRHEVLLQADPPKPGTVLRFTGEAVDRCAKAPQTGRSSVLAMQIVPPEELFYEILVRQRAERTRFMSVLEAAEKQTPVLDGRASAEDYLRVMRQHHAGSRQLDQVAGRIADTLQEMKLNQIGTPKSHRILQESVIDPIRALTAGPLNQLRAVLQTLAGAGSTQGATREEARRLHREVVTKMKNILEQMSQWESFVDVVNQVAEVIRMQHKVLKDTEKARETRTQDVFDDKAQ